MSSIQNLIEVVPREVTGLTMRVIQAGGMFLVIALLARTLGPEKFGVFGYAQAWVLLGAHLSQMGLQNFLVREVAAALYLNQPDRIRGLIRFADILTIGLSLTAIVVIYLLAKSAWLGQPELKILAIGLPYVFLFSNMMKNEAIARGLGRVVSGQVSQLIMRPVTQLTIVLVLVFWFGPAQITPEIAMVSLTGSALFSYVLSAIARSHYLSAVPVLPPKIDIISWRRGLGHLSLLTLVTAIGSTINLLVLGVFSVHTEVGFFAVSSQLTTLIPLGLTVMNSQQGNELSAAHVANNKTELERLARQACRFSLLVAIPLAIPALLFGRFLLAMFFGNAYREAAATLAILAIAQLINAAAGSVALILVAVRQENQVVIWQAITLMLQIALLCMLTPALGAIGAAIASMIGLIIWNTALVVKVYRTTGVLSLPLLIRNKSS